jgi:hypothetical protein
LERAVTVLNFCVTKESDGVCFDSGFGCWENKLIESIRMQGESAMGRCQYSMCQSLTILISFKKLGADYNIILCWNLPIPTVGRGRRDKGRVAELFLTAIVLTRCRSLGFL